MASQTRSVGAPRGLEARGKQQGLDVKLGPALRAGPRLLSTSQHATPFSLGSPFPCLPARVQERGTSSWTTSATSPRTRPPGRTQSLGLSIAKAPRVLLQFPDLLGSHPPEEEGRHSFGVHAGLTPPCSLECPSRLVGRAPPSTTAAPAGPGPPSPSRRTGLLRVAPL